MSIQENQISDLIDGGLIAQKELEERIKEIHINWGMTSKSRYELIKLIEDSNLDKYNIQEMFMAYNDGVSDENRFQTEKNYNRTKAIDWIKTFKKCPYKVNDKNRFSEKEIVKQHLDKLYETKLQGSYKVNALDEFIRQFEEEITDSWSALDFLKYLKENDLQIL